MARKTERRALVVSTEERSRLAKWKDSCTVPKRAVERAAILLRYVDGDGPTAIQKALGLSRPTIYKCIDKALAAGVEAGWEHRYHRAKEPVITEESKSSAHISKETLGLPRFPAQPVHLRPHPQSRLNLIETVF